MLFGIKVEEIKETVNSQRLSIFWYLIVYIIIFHMVFSLLKIHEFIKFQNIIGSFHSN
jgi:hypothetical protein